MTNEEKAFEIANKDREAEINLSCNKPSYYDGLLQGAIEMAKWKDEQLGEFLLRGGMVKDSKGYFAKDGDKVEYCVASNVPMSNGRLYWNDEGSFLIQDTDDEDANPYYLWEIVEWYVVK